MTGQLVVVVLLLTAGLVPAPAAAQGASDQRENRVIRARDGDVILVENADRVKVIRRRQANVRAIYEVVRRWVILLADYPSNGGAPDGVVDSSYSFRYVTGEWPLGQRWEGSAVIDEYSVVDGPGRGVGLTTSVGLIQFVGPDVVSQPSFRDPTAVATLRYTGSGRNGMVRLSFDDAERREIETAIRNAERDEMISDGPAGMVSSLSMSVGDAVAGPPRAVPPDQPVRVGSVIVDPKKIKDVRPEYPELARRAGVRGMVVVEIEISPEGTVRNARVLRSIPLLDAAAVEAVKQWVFEPTYLNGVAVPVIEVVTVRFP